MSINYEERFDEGIQNLGVEVEIWFDILNYEGFYQASNFGRIRSVSRSIVNIYGRTIKRKEKILKGFKDEDGYLMVSLSKNGKWKTKKVHRLVLETFCGPSPSKSVCRHFPDQTPTNNRLDNIQWGTSTENNKDTGKNWKYLGKGKMIRL